MCRAARKFDENKKMDLLGAVVSGPDARGFFYLEQAGFVARGYLTQLPGTRITKNKGMLQLPCNVIPRRGGAPVSATKPKNLALHAHQIEAIKFALASPVGCMVCLDVGLGKTAVACSLAASLRPFVVIAPKLSASAWVGPDADPEKYFDLKIVALESRQEELGSLGNDADVAGYFVNYEILGDHFGEILELNPALVILDESHELRNPRTKYSNRARAITRLACVKKRLALTATPVVNKISDLWAQLDAVQPGHWGPWTDWVVRYAGATPGEYTDWEEHGETNVEELRERLEHTLLRRSHAQVQGQGGESSSSFSLPPLHRAPVEVETSALDRKHYTDYLRCETDMLHEVVARGGDLRGLPLQRATAMHTSLSLAKVPVASDRVFSLLDEHGKLVVFCWYQETSERLLEKLRERGLEDEVFLGPIHGGVTSRKRSHTLAQFQETPRACLVCTLGTAGKSLNELVSAPAALFVDLYWVPATLIQAEGRIHRQGQKASECVVEYLKVKGGIDELMFNHLLRKAGVISDVVDDTSATSLCEQLGGGKSKREELLEFVAALAKMKNVEI